MKERPILFSTPMVQAILEGRKTMTRRVVKPQPINSDYWTAQSNAFYPNTNSAEPKILRCPHGQVGDRLWCKETYSLTDLGVIYKANMDDADMRLFGSTNRKWKPSIFMPRKFSRITLEITNIRVERLQDITEKDAIKEGVPPFSPNGMAVSSTIPRKQFCVLWNSINSDRGYSWESNPWVWVIEFVREVGQ